MSVIYTNNNLKRTKAQFYMHWRANQSYRSWKKNYGEKAMVRNLFHRSGSP